MVPDVSHLGERSFRDLLEVSQGPVIASHSNCRALCDVRRNLTDEQLRAIRDRGGVVGLNSYHGFVHADREQQTVETLARHAAHMAEVMGPEHVGCGFDFCFFTVSLDDAPVPVIRDNGTPEIQITGCSFAHTGTEPEGGSTYQYVLIENKECNTVISQNCFSSDDKNAIQLPSGANVGNGNEFGAECQEPWNPPEQPGSSGNTDPEDPPSLNDDFPYGPVIGGVIGGIAVIAVLAVLIFFFVVRRKRTESDNNSECLAHSDSVAA